MLRLIVLIALCLVLIFGLSAVTQAAAPKEPAAQEPAVVQRQAEEKAAGSRIDELNKKMDEFSAGARKGGAQARGEINRLYDEFKNKQGSAHKDLEDLRKATNEQWDKAKVKMDKAIAELNGLYERAKSKHAEKDESLPDKAK